MFCTLICCMDGRFINTTLDFIKSNYNFDFIDTITDAGPVGKLTDNEYFEKVKNSTIAVSLEKHNSKDIFIAAHEDCAGFPVDNMTQKEALEKIFVLTKTNIKNVKVATLFINKDGKIEIINKD